jgi:hypothetical protein
MPWMTLYTGRSLKHLPLLAAAEFPHPGSHVMNCARRQHIVIGTLASAYVTFAFRFEIASSCCNILLAANLARRRQQASVQLIIAFVPDVRFLDDKPYQHARHVSSTVHPASGGVWTVSSSPIGSGVLVKS